MAREEAALLRAVADAPEDDAPRLVYADWLEEHGQQARAQFIRLQLARAALEDHDPRAQELQERCRELTAQRGTEERWTPRLPRGMGYPEFHRGFVEKVSCRINDFLKGAERVKYHWPVRERVTLDADVYSRRAGAQLNRATRATRDAAGALAKTARDLFTSGNRG